MPDSSHPSIVLDAAQVNDLIYITRRWHELAGLVESVTVMADKKWESPLASAELELRQSTTVLLRILRTAVPDIRPDGLGAMEYVRDASVRIGQNEAVELAETARTARLRSHQLRPLLSEFPDETVTLWDARKIVDRLHYHAGELLQLVRLVDPARAALVASEWDVG